MRHIRIHFVLGLVLVGSAMPLHGMQWQQLQAVERQQRMQQVLRAERNAAVIGACLPWRQQNNQSTVAPRQVVRDWNSAKLSETRGALRGSLADTKEMPNPDFMKLGVWCAQRRVAVPSGAPVRKSDAVWDDWIDEARRRNISGSANISQWSDLLLSQQRGLKSVPASRECTVKVTAKVLPTVSTQPAIQVVSYPQRPAPSRQAWQLQQPGVQAWQQWSANKQEKRRFQSGCQGWAAQRAAAVMRAVPGATPLYQEHWAPSSRSDSNDSGGGRSTSSLSSRSSTGIATASPQHGRQMPQPAPMYQVPHKTRPAPVHHVQRSTRPPHGYAQVYPMQRIPQPSYGNGLVHLVQGMQHPSQAYWHLPQPDRKPWR